MKQKIPNAETLENSGAADIEISLSDKVELRRYLAKVNMLDVIPDNQKELYKYIRKTLSAGLTDRHRMDVVFAVLIERIARTAILMDIMERQMVQMTVPATTIGGGTGLAKSEYNVLQMEHRKCIEAFTNLKFAYDTKKKITTLERIRHELG